MINSSLIEVLRIRRDITRRRAASGGKGPSASPRSREKSLGESGRRRFWILLAALALLAAGLAVRLFDLDDPPLDFHPTRQLHSLILTRGMYAGDAAGMPDWQRERAIEQARGEGIIEPPVLEQLVVWVYRGANRVVPSAGRVFSIIFWMAGAIATYGLARQFSTPLGGLIAAGFWLVAPYGIYASRSFQPDPLMCMLIVFAWWVFTAWLRVDNRRRGWGLAVLAGLLGGAALLVKGTAVFLVAGGWSGLLMANMSLRGGLRSSPTKQSLPPGKEEERLLRRAEKLALLAMTIRDGQVWLIAGLTLLPYAIYTLWGTWGAGFLAGQFSLRFFPQYWVDPVFYLRWYNLLDRSIGAPWLFLGLLGAVLAPKGLARGLAWGGWIGYLALGFALSHHISTHDYYSLPLIVLIGLGLGCLAEALRRHLPEPRSLTGALAAIVLLAAAGMMAWEARTELKRTDYRAEPAFWANLTRVMGRDAGVVGLTQDYGERLAYYGWITPANWLTADDLAVRASAGQSFDLQELFTQLTSDKQFFLVTMPEELERQPEVKRLLEEGYPLFAEGPGYQIYDLRGAQP